jgi:ABC-type multidrug transport system fused ATPase/permease subunit
MTRTHPGPVSAGPGLGLAAGDIPVPGTLPAVIGVRGVRHNNLRDIDADVPLWRTVAVVGVPGSGKTSLAIGTLTAGDFDGY